MSMMAQNETAAAERKAQAEEISQLRNTMLDLRASMVELRLSTNNIITGMGSDNGGGGE